MILGSSGAGRLKKPPGFNPSCTFVPFVVNEFRTLPHGL
jgi:hypothetical protein